MRCLQALSLVFVLMGLAAQSWTLQVRAAVVSNTPPAGARTLRVGVMYSLSGKYAAVGTVTKLTREFWQQGVYDAMGLGSTNIYPVFTHADVMSNPAIAQSIALQWANQSAVDVIFAPENYLAGVVAASVPNIAVIAGVSGVSFLYRCDVPTPASAIPWLPPCIRNFGRRFNNLYSSGNVGQNLLVNWFGEVKQRGATTVAMIQDQDSYNQEICSSGLAYALDYKFRLVYNYTLSGTYAISETSVVMQTLKELQPDVVLFCNRPNCAILANLFYDNQYYPPAGMTVQCLDSAAAAALGSKLEYFLGMTSWDARLQSKQYQDNQVIPYGRRFASTDGTPSALNFKRQYFNYTGLNPTSTQVGVYVGNVVLEAAAILCNCTDAAGLWAAMKDIDSYSFAGPIVFDPYGIISSAETVIYQWRSLTTQIVSPASEVTQAWQYPAPTWEERIFSKVPYETDVEKAFIVLIVLFNAFNIIYFVLGFILFRNQVQIKAISWVFSLITCTGSILANFALLTWPVNSEQAHCDARGLLLVGFALQISPINAKLCRLDAIFNTKKLQVARVSDVRVALIALVHALFFIAPLIAWYVVAPFTLYHIPYDPLRAKLDYTDCQTQWIPFGPIILAVGMGMLIEASAFAFLTRNIDVRFRESKALVETFYYILFPVGVTILLQAVLGSGNSISRETMFALRTSLMLLANQVYLHTLFGERVKLGWSNQTHWAIFEESRLAVDNDAAVDQANHTVIGDESQVLDPPKSRMMTTRASTATAAIVYQVDSTIPGQVGAQ